MFRTYQRIPGGEKIAKQTPSSNFSPVELRGGMDGRRTSIIVLRWGERERVKSPAASFST
jgi:hypothetical protein